MRPMQGILYEEPSFWLFALVTVADGRLGRLDDRPRHGHHLAALSGCRRCYLLLLAGAVRFIHFALFERHAAVPALLSGRRSPWSSPSASSASASARARQMATQYRWLYERTDRSPGARSQPTSMDARSKVTSAAKGARLRPTAARAAAEDADSGLRFRTASRSHPESISLRRRSQIRYRISQDRGVT